MKTMTFTTLAALLIGAAACSPASIPQEAGAEAVSFEPRPDLAEGVGALPRLVGEGPAIAAINADLDRRDAAAGANGCDGGGGFERGVSQPMTGPGYISFWIARGYFCEGAAHPSFDQTAVTYDLATGQAVDWVTAAPGLQLTRGDATGLPADYEPGLSSTTLSAWYSAEASASAL